MQNPKIPKIFGSLLFHSRGDYEDVSTEISDNTKRYIYLDCDGKQNHSIQVLLNNSSDELNVTFEASNKDVSDPSEIVDEWTDVQEEITGSSSPISNGSSAINKMYYLDTTLVNRWVRVGYQRVSSSNDDGEVKILIKNA